MICLISFDPNLREPLWKSPEEAGGQIAFGMSRCDILKISDNEIQWFTGKREYGEGTAQIRERYRLPLILLSMGKEGSRAYQGDMCVQMEPFLQQCKGRHL